MKRVIVDFKKLTPAILSLLVAKYPDGYDDKDIISFRNAHNDLIEAVEVRTDEVIYLVKVSANLASNMERYLESDKVDTVTRQGETPQLPDEARA